MNLRILSLLCLAICVPLQAFPPAPHHLLYGCIRDEYGHPLHSEEIEVTLETSTGVQIKTFINPFLQPGTNYRLPIPMDAGVIAALYKSTALRPAMPFQIKVKIGEGTYLPIEMRLDSKLLGQAGERTLLNLTLGEDADWDGLPDAWERAMGGSLSQIDANDDTDGDGLRNMDEYLAGTYAFDNQNGFSLEVVGFRADRPLLAFTAVRGRTYFVEGSDDLVAWTPVEFIVPGVDGAQAMHHAQETKPLQVEATGGANSTAHKFYRLQLK